MTADPLDVASVDLAEARAKFDAARGVLLEAGDDPAVRAAIQKLDRISAELERAETSGRQTLAGMETVVGG